MGAYEELGQPSDAVVFLDTQTTPGSWQSQVQYLLTDHLGSLDVVTDSSGAIVERASFDAWGKRRKFDWTVYTASMPFAWQVQTLTRGYTFHEQLDPVGLIHMNGRVYDPELGRFMSPDIAIQDISNLQAFNAYSYVQNNPLSFTDPSGYFLSGLFKAIAGVFKAILNSQIGRALIQIAACTFGPAACVAASGVITLATGGSISQAIMAMGMTFIAVGAWEVTGGKIVPGLTGGMSGIGKIATKALVHGVVGGALSMSQGGSFLEGFASNAMGAGAGLLTQGTSIGSDMYLDTLAVATVGGLASEITGGKFVNGAITAAFANLYNKWGKEIGAAIGAAAGGGAVVAGGTACVAATAGNCVALAPQGVAAVIGGMAQGAYIGGILGSGLDDAFGRLYDIFFNEDASDKDPSTPVGRRGSPMNVPKGTNEDATIGGREYGGHSLDQMQGRGVTPSVVEDAIQNGAQSDDPIPGRIRHDVPGIRVITEGGRVVTVITR